MITLKLPEWRDVNMLTRLNRVLLKQNKRVGCFCGPIGYKLLPPVSVFLSAVNHTVCQNHRAVEFIL